MKNLALTLTCLGAFLVAPHSGSTQSLKTLNKPIIEELDEVSPFHEGLAAIRRDTKWGFIDTEGNLVIEFRDDLVWSEKGDPESHDLTPFKDGYALGILVAKTFKGDMNGPH